MYAAYLPVMRPVFNVMIRVVSELMHGPATENETVRQLAAREVAQREAEREFKRQVETNANERQILEGERRMLEHERRVLEHEQRIFQDLKRQDAEALELLAEKKRGLAAIEILEQEFAGRLQEFEQRTEALKAKLDEYKEQTESLMRLLRWPSQQEIQDAQCTIKYSATKFQFAIVGRAGSGKSSLVNAFLNLGDGDPGAAGVGTTETTLTIGRYPDPGTEPPRKWMVWYDVPGAGTQSIPRDDYFIKQGLFLFDCIILVLGGRFDEIDVCILQDCQKYKIPAFIVRSKADQDISNTFRGQRDRKQIIEDPGRYAPFRDVYIAANQRTVEEELGKAGLPGQRVYIVSSDVLRIAYDSTLQDPVQENLTQLAADMHPIHEQELVKDLLTMAAERRRARNYGDPVDVPPTDPHEAMDTNPDAMVEE